MKSIVILLFTVALLGVGCSGKKVKSSDSVAGKAETQKTPGLKGKHMRGEAKVLGKEDSIAHKAKKAHVEKAEIVVPKKKMPVVVSEARDEFRCSKGDADSKLKARKLNSEGLGYYRKGLHKAAITAFRYAYSLDCGYLLATTNTASTYAKSGDFIRALGWLNVAYKINKKKTIEKLQRDRDYTEFISKFLLAPDQPKNELANSYLAAVHKIAPTAVPQKVGDVAPKVKAKKVAVPVDTHKAGSGKKSGH